MDNEILLEIHSHGWSKISLFSHFCTFIIPWSYLDIGFKNTLPLKCLIPVKTMCNLHCWIQLSPVFQNIPQHMKICDPTRVNEADVVRGQIVILLSMYSTGIMNHFDTKHYFDTIFQSKDIRKTKLVCCNFKNWKIHIFKQLQVLFRKRVNETNKQHSM